MLTSAAEGCHATEAAEVVEQRHAAEAAEAAEAVEHLRASRASGIQLRLSSGHTTPAEVLVLQHRIQAPEARLEAVANPRPIATPDDAPPQPAHEMEGGRRPGPDATRPGVSEPSGSGVSGPRVAGPMVPPPEKRTDPEGWRQYTRDEFLAIWGGTEEWDAAGPGGVAPASPAPD